MEPSGDAGTKVRKHALSLPAGARRVEDDGVLSHGSSATPPHAWAENCPPHSAGSCKSSSGNYSHDSVNSGYNFYEYKRKFKQSVALLKIIALLCSADRNAEARSRAKREGCKDI